VATVYMAFSSAGIDTLKRHAGDQPVNMLVAFPLLDLFEKHRRDFNIQKWVLDSGAFSAWNCGMQIDLTSYMIAAKSCDACEIVGLDDISNYKQTIVNLSKMWAAGIKAIPVFHQGEPVTHLEWCCKHADKIGFGSRKKGRKEWLKACMQAIWPKKVHGFSLAGRDMLELIPFDSVDASSMWTAPGRFGQFAGFTGRQVHLKSRMTKDNPVDLWCEVLEHQKRQVESEWRWRHFLPALTDRSETLYTTPLGVGSFSAKLPPGLSKSGITHREK
jgi:hypothetical protein